ncbi:MAG: hypothetical protein ACK4S4_02740 [Pyrinomonadaceae bacterium]
MFRISHFGIFARRFVTLLIVVSVLAVTSAFAQTSQRYDVELAVKRGDKSVMTDADIVFGEKTVSVIPDKAEFKGETKEFAYADIKQADHSYSKKPMLSGGGAVATALLVGVIFALPFLFVKKKKHWMTIQTEKEFAVMQTGDNNWRQLIAEFQIKGVKVNDLKEAEK